jgi:acyl dehydratase
MVSTGSTGDGVMVSTRSTGVGDRLPEWSLPITPTLVVSTAIATRDFQDVHHDRDLAQSYGSRDIFVNILTSNGLVERYVTDSLGYDLDVKSISIRLGAPAYPGDTLTFTGEVSAVEGDEVTIAVRGAVSLGDHVSGTVVVSRMVRR